jgi:diadenosine tetraphosphate (Ap4A) HIT family hydrolase
MSQSDCPFCEKLGGLSSLQPGEVVWQFPHGVAFLGQWQFYRGYCVLAARRHAREPFHLPDDVRRDFLDEMCLLARAIDQAFRPHKLNCESLGNQVPHLHWHLFPRSGDDPDRLSPVWLTLAAAESDPELRRRLEGEPSDRPAIATALRQTLTSLKAPRA